MPDRSRFRARSRPCCSGPSAVSPLSGPLITLWATTTTQAHTITHADRLTPEARRARAALELEGRKSGYYVSCIIATFDQCLGPSHCWTDNVPPIPAICVLRGTRPLEGTPLPRTARLRPLLAGSSQAQAPLWSHVAASQVVLLDSPCLRPDSSASTLATQTSGDSSGKFLPSLYFHN